MRYHCVTTTPGARSIGQKLPKIKENQEYEKNTNHRHCGDSCHSLQRDTDDDDRKPVHPAE